MPTPRRRPTKISEAAKALAKRGASEGGKARAQSLSPQARSEGARRAAEARWGTAVQQASHDGTIQIGAQTLGCAVLEDGTRIINQGTLLTALGRSRRPKGAEGGGIVLFAANLRSYVSRELEADLRDTIPYRTVKGAKSVGYRADLLPQVCEVYLDARNEDDLLDSQQPAAEAAEILVRGLARVGIIALVDEATGYEEVRARGELQRILDAYVLPELRKWTKTFPDEFFRQVYRMQRWDYRPGTAKRTPYVGKLINKYIYDELPHGVLDELRRLNPRNAHGNRPNHFHQFLTADTGSPHLDKQISTVTTLMRISHNKAEFQDLFERAFPPPQERLPLVIPEEEDEEG